MKGQMSKIRLIVWVWLTKNFYAGVNCQPSFWQVCVWKAQKRSDASSQWLPQVVRDDQEGELSQKSKRRMGKWPWRCTRKYCSIIVFRRHMIECLYTNRLENIEGVLSALRFLDCHHANIPFERYVGPHWILNNTRSISDYLCQRINNSPAKQQNRNG